MTKGTYPSRLASLRGKLGTAAFAGLTTTAVLTGLLLLTASAASDVVSTAHEAHDRVRIYMRLLTAARDYEGAGYLKVREASPQGQKTFEQARVKLVQLLAEVAHMPARDERDSAVHARIAREGQAVLVQYRNAEQLVHGVDAKWRESGSRAALMEVARISAPIFAMESTLQGEIQRGDTLVADATGRAQWLIKVAVIASLVGLLLVAGFSLIVQMLLHMRLRPGLSRLEEGAQAFGAGQLDHRIGLGGRDELSRLSNAFDTMARILAEKQQALHEIQAGLERSVIMRTTELQRLNAELSAADGRRKAFLADVSHELRTPLTIIRGEAEVALRTADQKGFDPHEVFERILQQTHDLGRMVNDLFLIAKAEAGVLPLRCEVLDLREIAARVSNDFETLVNEMGGSIRIEPGAAVLAMIDPERLRRAIAALIENALRHCQTGVNIIIEVFAEEEGAVIAVCDDGPGIHPSQAQQLFERFRRGETRGEGSGLGLSLVSALVEAHGGRAYLEPRVGGGTRAVTRFALHLLEQEAA